MGFVQCNDINSGEGWKRAQPTTGGFVYPSPRILFYFFWFKLKDESQSLSLSLSLYLCLSLSI